ncbi:hypothetical protein OLX02_08645 [Novosphingobium sp. KCTC 2891]|nr:hypothetical protein [Novosphingobium sp. KCTC 2891]MCW1382890.1 hypothetical protein [Novosphingobium sp. KCTC 2891]
MMLLVPKLGRALLRLAWVRTCTFCGDVRHGGETQCRACGRRPQD